MASYHLLSIAEGLGIYRITVKPGDGHPAMNGYTYQVIDSATGKPIQNSMLYRRKDNLEIWHDGEPVLILKGYYSDDISVQYSVDEYSGDFIDYRDPRDLPDMTRGDGGQATLPETNEQTYYPAIQVDQGDYPEGVYKFADQSHFQRTSSGALQPWVQALLSDDQPSATNSDFVWAAKQSFALSDECEFSGLNGLGVGNSGYSDLMDMNTNLWG